MSLSSCNTGKLTKVRFPQVKDRKRKRKRSLEVPSPTTTAASQKRPRTSSLRPPKDTTSDNRLVDVVRKATNPVKHWISTKFWPTEPFEPESNMNHLLARKKSRSRQSEAGSTTSSQKPRESKSIPYAHPSYETELAKRGSFMDTSDEGITEASILRTRCSAMIYSLQLAEIICLPSLSLRITYLLYRRMAGMVMHLLLALDWGRLGRSIVMHLLLALDCMIGRPMTGF